MLFQRKYILLPFYCLFKKNHVPLKDENSDIKREIAQRLYSFTAAAQLSTVYVTTHLGLITDKY